MLDELRAEFPDLSITKIRYLETEGLLEPERTPSGYRKFSLPTSSGCASSCGSQRDKFWPLSHIRQVLDDMDRGVVPDTDARARLAGAAPESGRRTGCRPPTRSPAARTSMRLSRAELLEAAGIDAELLDEIEEFGLIAPRPAQTYYDGDACQIASIVGELAELGLEPRHLRAFRSAADREVASVRADRVAARAPARQRRRAERTVASPVASLSVVLQAVLVRTDSVVGRLSVRELEVVGVRVEMPTNQPLVLLREVEGTRYLPIWIGAVEASAIAYAQQGTSTAATVDARADAAT